MDTVQAHAQTSVTQSVNLLAVVSTPALVMYFPRITTSAKKARMVANSTEIIVTRITMLALALFLVNASLLHDHAKRQYHQLLRLLQPAMEEKGFPPPLAASMLNLQPNLLNQFWVWRLELGAELLFF